jgi:hypothetical protein
MDQSDPGIDLVQASLCSFAAMRRAVIHDPEQAVARTIGFLSQHLVHQLAKRLDAGRGFTTAPPIPSANVPSGQILQRPATFVFIFDTSHSVWPRRQSRMAADTRLEAGLFIGAEDVVLGAKRRVLPEARIPIQNRSRLLGEVGITRRDPVLTATV